VTTTAEQQLDRRVDKRSTAVLGSPNRMRLAVFSANMAGGANLTTAPQAPKVTWAETVRIARAADQAGVEALIPVSRWRGMAPASRRPAHRSFDTVTWAAGVAAVTERIQVFGTAHVPTTHPLAAAKQGATIDHISGGRFGLNVVAGWNDSELRMFGPQHRGPADRYGAAEEWLTALKRIWHAEDEFDADGPGFPGTGILSEPKPLQAPEPVIMNGGTSPAGRDFAARHADITFALLPAPESAPALVADLKRHAREAYGRELLVFGAAHVVCAEDRAEARRLFDRMVFEHGDWDAADSAVRMLLPNVDGSGADRRAIAASAIAGFFALPMVGTSDDVVEQMAVLADAGLDGLALSWLDYEEGLAQYGTRIRPALVEAGLRQW